MTNQYHMNRREFLKTATVGTAGLVTVGGLSGRAAAQEEKLEPDIAEYGLRYRQIHLDFHTSEAITGIGSQFDPDEFADTLKRAHVNSVTCFGRGHHGWIYYDTKNFRERRHPHLTRSLLNEQIEACHARDIRVPIYITIQWDHYTAREHPEWIQITPEGSWVGTPPYEGGFYRRLCLNTPYVDFVKEVLGDLFQAVPVDGLFLDIVTPQDCSCKWCLPDMLDAGLDPTDQAQRRQFGQQVTDDFMADVTRFIKQNNGDCSIFYNSGHIGTRHRPSRDAFTHFELESLPSGGWGYMHFPLSVRYARVLKDEYMGMTGKFHTSWGDFHSFKNQAALQFECFQMLALNAKCSIGDQLYPDGRLDPATYDLVGSVYSEVEAKEPWCRGAVPKTEIGVLTPEAFAGPGARVRVHPSAVGAVRMLQEARHQLDVLDEEADFSPYKLLILPDVIPVSAQLNRKLQQYIRNGGALIASFESGMDDRQEEFTLNALGVRKTGDGPVDQADTLVRGREYGRNDYAQYIIPLGDIGTGLPETEHVMYMHGMHVETVQGARTLAPVVKPYFYRNYQHFCSHRQTPSSGETDGPAVVRNGRAIYFAHPIFSQYNENAPKWCKTMFLNAVEMLLPDPLVRVDGPSTIIATLNRQSAKNREVLHLLNYIPERRGEDFDIIEDVIPLHEVDVSVKEEGRIRSVTLVPQGEDVAFRRRDGRVEFTVPRLHGHQMVSLEA